MSCCENHMEHANEQKDAEVPAPKPAAKSRKKKKAIAYNFGGGNTNNVTASNNGKKAESLQARFARYRKQKKAEIRAKKYCKKPVSRV